MLVPLQLVHFILVPSDTEIGLLRGRSAAGAFFTFLELLAGTVAALPTTVAISEICLGMKPGFSRSYKRAFSDPGRVVKTYLHLYLVIFVRFLLLFIPGIVFSIWYMFTGPVLVLEGLGGSEAMRRSRQLGKGHYWRNFGVYLVAVILFYLIVFLLGGVLGFLFAIFGQSFPALIIVATLFGDLAAPFLVSLAVLLYYDMRARRESYGAAQLTEDLRL